MPIAPTERLVVTGFNRFVRNPMYVGLLTAILGQALLFDSLWLVALRGDRLDRHGVVRALVRRADACQHVRRTVRGVPPQCACLDSAPDAVEGRSERRGVCCVGRSSRESHRSTFLRGLLAISLQNVDRCDTTNLTHRPHRSSTRHDHKTCGDRQPAGRPHTGRRRRCADRPVLPPSLVPAVHGHVRTAGGGGLRRPVRRGARRSSTTTWPATGRFRSADSASRGRFTAVGYGTRLTTIPYGETITYGELAAALADGDHTLRRSGRPSAAIRSASWSRATGSSARTAS